MSYRNPLVAVAPATLFPMVVVSVTVLLLAGCATAPPEPDPGVEAVRAELRALQSDPELAERAPVALEEAKRAVRRLENPEALTPTERAHRIYVAERRIGIAEAIARREYAEAEVENLREERQKAVVEARAVEAEEAQRAAEAARRAEAERRREAEAARAVAEERAREAELARLETERAQSELAELRSELEAERTERGLIVTLSDVLFEFDSAELKPGAKRNLQTLIEFLRRQPGRGVRVEGHTDAVGEAEYNLSLSQRRAEAVRQALIDAGIDNERIVAQGYGESLPVASNNNEAGRQQNRRVEIVIENPEQPQR